MAHPSASRRSWRSRPPRRSFLLVLTLEKDRYSVKYFMPGTIDFPRGPGLPDKLLFRPTALAGDNRTFSLALGAPLSS